MKQRHYITTFSLIVALAGLSPVEAADAGKDAKFKHPNMEQDTYPTTQKLALSPNQLDGVTAGYKCSCETFGEHNWKVLTQSLSLEYILSVLQNGGNDGHE